MFSKTEVRIIIDELGFNLWLSEDEYKGILESSNSIGEAIIEIGNMVKSREKIKSMEQRIFNID